VQADISEYVQMGMGVRVFHETMQHMGFPAAGFTVKKYRGAVSLDSNGIDGIAADAESAGMDFGDVGPPGMPRIGDNPVSKGVDHPRNPSRRPIMTK
jgi:hypothetical protein